MHVRSYRLESGQQLDGGDRALAVAEIDDQRIGGAGQAVAQLGGDPVVHPAQPVRFGGAAGRQAERASTSGREPRLLRHDERG
jgi:hypothetical protein